MGREAGSPPRGSSASRAPAAARASARGRGRRARSRPSSVPRTMRSVSGNADVGRQRGMAAREDQLQSLVGKVGLLLGHVDLPPVGRAAPSLRARVRSRRRRSMARLRAVAMIQAPGLRGGASSPARHGDLEGVLDGVLREAGIAGRARDGGDRTAHSSRKTVRDVYVETSASRMTSGLTLDGRASAAGDLRRHWIASSSESASIQVVAAQRLLRLRERPVGDLGLAVADWHGRRTRHPLAARRRRRTPGSGRARLRTPCTARRPIPVPRPTGSPSGRLLRR